jgi:catalase
VTQDVSACTKAAVFQPGIKTETLIRFSTVAGERGSPDTWRHMNGYSSHTCMWVNAKGERFWVKYHFKTDQSIEGSFDLAGRKFRYSSKLCVKLKTDCVVWNCIAAK